MSGGGNKKRSSGRTQGWEEAGAEFYTESYPSGPDIELEVFQRDPSNLTTLLPSKQSRYTTMRTTSRYTDTRTFYRRTSTRSRQSTARRASTFNNDLHVAMLPDLSENLSNEETTWEEILQIKSLPIHMHQKKEMKIRLQNATYLRLQGYEQFKWKQRKRWHHFKLRWSEICSKLQIWRSSFKTIESKVGNGILSYFYFIKLLMLMNLAIFLIIFILIILPILIFNNHALIPTDNNIMCNNQTNDCCIKIDLNETNLLNVYDILQLTNLWEWSFLFYGAYTSQPFEVHDYTYVNQFANNFTNNLTNVQLFNLNNTNYLLKQNMSLMDNIFDFKHHSYFVYNLPLAYVLILPTVLILCVSIIFKNAKHGFKQKLIEAEGYLYEYCNLMFSSWDFCVRDESNAKQRQNAIFHELKMLLKKTNEDDKKLINCFMNNDNCFKLILLRTFINLIFIFILCVCALFIYFVIQFSSDQLIYLNQLNRNNNMTINYFFEDFNNLFILFYQCLPYITIVVLNMLIPNLFKSLIRVELYSSQYFTMKLTMLRVVLLRLTLLITLLAIFFFIIKCNNKENISPDSFCNNVTSTSLILITPTNNCNQTLICWETYVGQQIYKLVVIDLVINVIVTFFINMPRAFIAKHCHNKLTKLFGEQEFDLNEHVLHVIYIQMLTWCGFFYMPLLPLITAVILCLMFYFKKFICLNNCKPTKILYRQTNAACLYLFILLVSFVLAFAPVTYATIYLEPSKNCGPFRGYNSAGTLLRDLFLTWPGWLQEVFLFFGTYMFLVPVVIVLFVFVCYYNIINDANVQMVGVLKNQLVLEGHDKQFLLNRLSVFIKQQQECQKKLRNIEMLRERDRTQNAST